MRSAAGHGRLRELLPAGRRRDGSDPRPVRPSRPDVERAVPQLRPLHEEPSEVSPNPAGLLTARRSRPSGGPDTDAASSRSLRCGALEALHRLLLPSLMLSFKSRDVVAREAPAHAAASLQRERVHRRLRDCPPGGQLVAVDGASRRFRSSDPPAFSHSVRGSNPLGTISVFNGFSAPTAIGAATVARFVSATAGS